MELDLPSFDTVSGLLVHFDSVLVDTVDYPPFEQLEHRFVAAVDTEPGQVVDKPIALVAFDTGLDP